MSIYRMYHTIWTYNCKGSLVSVYDKYAEDGILYEAEYDESNNMTSEYI